MFGDIVVMALELKSKVLSGSVFHQLFRSLRLKSTSFVSSRTSSLIFQTLSGTKKGNTMIIVNNNLDAILAHT